MSISLSTQSSKLAFFALAMLVAPVAAFAQTDEIQVYDGEIAGKGIFNLTLHNNFTPKGVKGAAFPGGLSNDRNLNGVAEWAYGVNDWFEAGLYLPLYSVSADRGPTINGGKIRFLFARPDAAKHKFFYGANFEFSLNAKHWDDRRYTSEIRPIIGWHLQNVDLIVNPILDNSWYGGIKGLDFAPATRVAYNFNPKLAVAVEEYSDYGRLRGFDPAKDQWHQVWGVLDFEAGSVKVETGIGFGMTSATDKVSLKLILSRDLNSKKPN